MVLAGCCHHRKSARISVLPPFVADKFSPAPEKKLTATKTPPMSQKCNFYSMNYRDRLLSIDKRFTYASLTFEDGNDLSIFSENDLAYLRIRK